MNQEWDEVSARHALAEMLGVVQIGRKRYATSLIWNNAESDGGALLTEARAAAERIDSDLLALRPSKGERVAQFALGDRLLGHQPGLPSLAAALAERTEGSLYGAWQLCEQLWCLIGVRADGSIAFDKAMAQEQALKIEFEDGVMSEQWDQLICPADWLVEGSVAAQDLASLLGRSKVRLRALQVNRARWVLLLLLPSLLVSGAWLGWQEFQTEDPPLAVSRPPPPLPAMPWAGKPLARVLLRACSDNLLAHAVDAGSIPGWKRLPGRCDGNQVSYGLERASGSNNWPAALVKTLPGVPQLSEVSEGKATLSWRLPPLERYDPQSPGTSLDGLRRNLQAHFDELFIPIALSDGDRQLYWQGLKFSLDKLEQNPMNLLPLLGMLPATLIDEVGFDADNRTWHLNGQVYERKQPTEAERKASQAT